MNPSQRIPEGVDTVKAEGKDLARAVAAAAETIGVDEKRVEFKLDLDHFRSSTGTSVSKRTVAIIAWDSPKSDEELAAEAESKPAPKKRSRKKDDDDGGKRRSKSRSRDDDDRGGRSRGDRKERSDRGDRKERRSKDSEGIDPELEETDASKFALEWFETLIGHMGIEGELKSGGDDERVQIWISAERAGRLIGKRGSTLGAIRHLLGLAVKKKFGDLTIDVDVADTRPNKGGGGRSDSDKGGKKRGRRGSRSRDGGGGSDRNRYPEDKLKALARRAAEKAAEEGKTITINLELNSYDRRIVHLEVGEIDGVESRSEEREDGVKIIQVAPLED